MRHEQRTAKVDVTPGETLGFDASTPTESFRLFWFGPEPEQPHDDSWDRIRASVVSIARLLEAASVCGKGTAELEVLTGMRDRLASAPLTLQHALRDAEGHGARSLRVLLMGRTMAGKSTVLEALSHGDGTRRGRGQQRTTRAGDMCERAMVELPGVSIIDVPGVGAADGIEDREFAMAQVSDADIILWVATTEAAKETTAQSLRELGALGKPIIVALNCRRSLVRHGDEFLANPEDLYRDAGEHAAVVARHLAQAGAASVDVIPIHAEAAWRSVCGGTSADAFRAASRIDALIDHLGHELARAPTRKFLSAVDIVRWKVQGELVDLHGACEDLDIAINDQRVRATALYGQLGRVVDTYEEQATAGVRRLVDVRRDWPQDQKVDRRVEQRWQQALADLHEDLTTLMRVEAAALAGSLRATAEQEATDWAALPRGDRDARNALPGFGRAWIGRTARITLAAATGLTALIVAPTLVAAAAITVAAVALQWLGSWALKKWAPTAAVLERHRRRALEEAVGASLDDEESRWLTAIGEQMATLRRALKQQLESNRRTSHLAAEALKEWRTVLEAAAAALSDIDTATAQGVLRREGRLRAASSVKRAARSPGIGTVVELDEPAFTELALFPVRFGEPLAPAPPHSGGVLNAVLTFPEVTAARLGRTCVYLTGDNQAAPRLQEIARLLRRFSGTDVTIAVHDNPGAET